MPAIPRAQIVQDSPNLFNLIWFDPGGGATGWAHFVVHYTAFSRPEHKLLARVLSWDCGEFTGHDNMQMAHAVEMMQRIKYGGEYRSRFEVGTEDFQLAQTIGGKNLLSPVRLNAILDWECSKLGTTIQYQDRTMRIGVTPERLNAFGFQGRWTKTGKGKDAFAAMQHGVVRLRRLKEISRGRPWKLSDGIVANAVWDCSCARTPTERRSKNSRMSKTGSVMRHDLVHQ